MFSAEKKARLISNYPDAFTDTNDVIGGAPFIYKTGPAWFREHDYPFRQMRPVADNHPIKPKWCTILHDIKDHFQKVNLPPTIIAGLAFGNGLRKINDTFCKLIVVIGVPPEDDYDFNRIKDAAEYSKQVILTDAGFPDIDVAIREWVVSPSDGTTKAANLPSLDPLLRRNETGCYNVFSSNPGLAIAQLKEPLHEGMIGAYFQLTDESTGRRVLLGLTCCHVVSSSRAVAAEGVTKSAANAQGHKIIAIGEVTFKEGIDAVQKRIDSLQESIASERKALARLQRHVENKTQDLTTAAKIFESIQQDIRVMNRRSNYLQELLSRVTTKYSEPSRRYIGQVYLAEPIMASSSNAFSAHTVDWAFVELDEEAFASPFTGNKVYIGGRRIAKEQYAELGFRCLISGPDDRSNILRPEDCLLQISGYVPESEMPESKHSNTNDEHLTLVIKNGGSSSGATMGWLNGLPSYVRRQYTFPEQQDAPIELEAMETTIVPHSHCGAFSKGGDSGSAILDRHGRFLALLTGGGHDGRTDDHDITFSTAAYQLMPRIAQTVPGATLLPPMIDPMMN